MTIPYKMHPASRLLDHSGTLPGEAKETASKPILCLDFDGVIHSYTSGWQGAQNIPDPPVDGAIEFIVEASNRFRIAVYSSRCNQIGGIISMKSWLRKHMDNDDVFALIEWPTSKPSAFVTIDDRAITFTGTWPSLDEIAAFKPWNKK